MTWLAFQRQYEAQGREKGDGYSPSDFDELTPEERARARAMMLARALEGDTIDLNGLQYVGDAKTAAVLEAARDGIAARKWDWDIIRLDVLHVLTGNYAYLAALSRYLDGAAAVPQVRAAYVLSFHALPPEADVFIVDRLADGRHEPAFDGLMRAWIGLHERKPCDIMGFQRHLAFIRRVSSAAPSDRPALLAEAAPGLATAAG